MNNPTDHIMEEYLKSSIYVMSSVFEGFAMVLLEAMSCGLPCVSFDCPYGPRNVITDGEDGFLVEYLNSQALADQICNLIENEELRKRMGSNGRRNVLRFSRETIMPQWVDGRPEQSDERTVRDRKIDIVDRNNVSTDFFVPVRKLLCQVFEYYFHNVCFPLRTYCRIFPFKMEYFCDKMRLCRLHGRSD